MRMASIFALALIAVTACSGGDDSTPTPTPETHTVSGIFTIKSISCTQMLSSVYSNYPGSAMTIRDSQGVVLSTGYLSRVGVDKDSPIACELSFSFSNVPRLDSYTVSNGIAGSLSYTYDELKANNWRVSVIVG